MARWKKATPCIALPVRVVDSSDCPPGAFDLRMQSSISKPHLALRHRHPEGTDILTDPRREAGPETQCPPKSSDRTSTRMTLRVVLRRASWAIQKVTSRTVSASRAPSRSTFDQHHAHNQVDGSGTKIIPINNPGNILSMRSRTTGKSRGFSRKRKSSPDIAMTVPSLRQLGKAAHKTHQ